MNELKNSTFTDWSKGSPKQGGLNKDLPTADKWLNKVAIDSGDGAKFTVSKSNGMKLAMKNGSSAKEHNYYTRQYIRDVMAASRKIYVMRAIVDSPAGIEHSFYVNARFNNSDPGGDSKRRVHVVNHGKSDIAAGLKEISIKFAVPDLSDVKLKKDKDEGLEVAFLIGVTGKNKSVDAILRSIELDHQGYSETGNLAVYGIEVMYL